MVYRKFVYLFNKRGHYKNRIKQRNGSSLWFLFSKVIDKRNTCDPTKSAPADECLVWKFRNHIYITQSGQLQTYIKSKSI